MTQTLLLTATITPPPGVPVLTRVDPALRMADYVDALRFYRPLIGRCFDGIVFVDNSASDLGPLQAEAHGHAIELISFAGLDYPVSRGRGYGEMKLVEHAMAHSSRLAQADVIWKCTGRYKLRNIEALTRSRPDVDLYVHCIDYPYRRCELFSMAFNQRAWHGLLSHVAERLRNDIVPGTHTNEEMSFRTAVDEAQGLRIGKRFRRTPVIDGVRGWNNTAYSRGWDAKIMLRRMANTVTPWVWI